MTGGKDKAPANDRERPSLREIGGAVLWTREVHGVGGQNPLFDPGGRALYVSDGWGNRPVPALRLRRLDLGTGVETARWPCGTGVRCLASLDGGDLLVATDHRLARLDSATLAEQARWNGAARHALTVAVAGGVAVAGNPARPTISLLDLATGRVMRKRHGPVVAILSRRSGDPVLVGGSRGGLASIAPATGAIRELKPTAPAMSAALDDAEQGVWLIPGSRIDITRRPGGATVRPGDPVTRVAREPLGDGQAESVEIPLAVRTVAVGAGSVWFTPAPVAGTRQYVVIREPSGGWRVWLPPDRQVVDAVAPALALAVTSVRVEGTERRAFTCHRIGG